MHFNTPYHFPLVHWVDRHLDYSVIVDDLTVHDETRTILSPRRLCRQLCDSCTTTGLAVAITDEFSHAVYDLHRSTAASMGATVLSWSGATPKIFAQNTWWPSAEDACGELIGYTRRPWISTDVEACALWLTNPQLDPVSHMRIDDQLIRSSTYLAVEKLRVWANLDVMQVVLGRDSQREVYEICRLAQRVVALPILELDRRLERLELAAQLSSH